MRCVVPKCDRESSKTFPGITYQTFPTKSLLRASWLEALHMAGSDLQEHSEVCSKHFLEEDMLITNTGLRTVRAGAVPIDDVKVCRICFASTCKLYPMIEYKIFSNAYEKLTGLSISNHDNLPTYLCTECAHQLLNYTRFRSTSLRAHSTLLDIVERHGYVTIELIKSFKASSSLPEENAADDVKVENNLNYCNNIRAIDETNDNTVRTSRLLEDDFVDEIKIENGAIIRDNLSTVYVTNVNTVNTCSLLENNVKVENDSIDRNYPSVVVNVTNENTVCTSSLLKEDNVNDIKIEYDDIVNSELFNKVDVNNDDMVCTASVFEDDPVGDSNKKDCIIQHDNNEEPNVDYTENGDVIVDEDYSSGDHPLTEAVLRAKRSVTEVQEVIKIPKEPLQEKVDTCRDPEADSGLLVNKSFSCEICSYQTHNKRYFFSHLKAHDANKCYPCNVCSFITTRRLSLISHLKIHSGGKVYSCHVCNKTHKRMSDLTEHLQIHSSEKPFSCKVCKKAFTRKEHVKTHLRTHSGEKPYSCKVCNIAFTQKQHFTIHLRTHSAKKPYSCDVCNKAFVSNAGLMYHSRTHSGEKPYSCQVCNKTFIRKGDVNRHLRTHTDEKPYSCKFCNKAFTRRQNFTMHLRTHSGEKPYLCNDCNKAFTQKRYLITHLRTHLCVNR